MNIHQHNTENFRTVIKLLGIVAFLLFLTSASFGQNTKGDRAEVGGSSNQRQTRFKPKGQKKSKPKPGSHRVNPHKFSVAKIARYLGIGQGSTKNVYSQHDRRFVNNKHQKPSVKQKVGFQDFSDRDPLVHSRPTEKSRNIYPLRGSYFINHKKQEPSIKQKAWKGSSSGSRLVVRSNTGKSRNVYSASAQYSSNPSPKPRDIQHARGKKVKIIPRSASSSFIHHKTLNTNAGFWNVKKKPEVAVTTDIAGRPLRTKNYQTPTRELIPSSNRHYSKRKRIGDRPYKSTGGPRYVTATQTSPKAWQGDITGRKVRGRNFASKPHTKENLVLPFRMLKAGYGDKVYNGLIPGRGNNSVSAKRKRVSSLFSKMPGVGAANGIATFPGNIKTLGPLKGGGSRSGKLWNNKGIAILGKQTKSEAKQIGTFQGNIKAYRPIKGGGSVSGRLWNNKGMAVTDNQSKAGTKLIGGFQGNIKAYKPVKGGGSISGRLWNNKGMAVLGEQPKRRARLIGAFQGNIKAYKPVKGGGSISGKPWNNKGMAVLGEQPKASKRRIGTFQGNVKANRPLKGGGSVSGRVWNNEGTPILPTQPGLSAQGMWTFRGDLKSRKPAKGGGSVSGKLWNNKRSPIPVRTPPSRAAQIGGFPVKIKKSYIKNENAVEESLKKEQPNETVYSVDNLQIKMKRRNYVANKNSAKDALRKLEPTKNTLATEDLHVKVKQYNYIHNSSSAKAAVNVREPGKAFAKAADYQGNIRMKKFDFTKLFSQKYHALHPDAKFVKVNKNNVPAERDLVTNIKLWWARNFRKNDTQPDHLKDKDHKPRYDKGEQGLWNE